VIESCNLLPLTANAAIQQKPVSPCEIKAWKCCMSFEAEGQYQFI
jgi:hypothetical protein